MKKVRVAVVGLNRGMDHLHSYQKSPQAELVAICDIDRPWLEYVGKQEKVSRLYSNIDDLLKDKDIDAVSICTPTAPHAEHTIKALNAGKHVLCEKPMAMNADQAQAMIDAAKANKKTLMVCQNRRFLAESQLLKRCVGQLGKIYFVRCTWMRPMGTFMGKASRATGEYDRSWFNRRSDGGGVLRDLGVHLLDLVMWLMGFPAIGQTLGLNCAVFTPSQLQHQGIKGDAEDFASGMVRFANDSAVQFAVCFGSHSEKEDVTLEILGSDGGAFVSRRMLTVIRQQDGAQAITHFDRLPAGSEAEFEFIDSIVENRPPMVRLDESLQVISLLDKLYAAGIMMPS